MLGVLGGLAVAGMAAAYLSPLGTALSASADQQSTPAPVTPYTSALGDAQTVTVASVPDSAASLNRPEYTVYVIPKPKPTPKPTPTAAAQSSSSASSTPSAPQSSSFAAPFVSPDPGTAQSIAFGMVKARGWSDSEFSCLVALWNRESGWRVNAYNPSGAYGIPQALPGSKMASAGPNWQTNPATQIAWGLGYISSRYGTPCAAWAHSNATNWY